MPPKASALDFLTALPDAERDAAFASLMITIRHGTKAEVDERCRFNLREFGHTFFGHMMTDPATDEFYPEAKFHAELIQILEDAILGRGEYDFKEALRKIGAALAAPRGHAKSTWTSLIAPTWALLYEHKQYAVIISDTGDQAEAIGTNLRREFEDNAVIRHYFGNTNGFRFGLKWTLRNFEIVKCDDRGRRTFTGRIMVSGSGSSLRGMRDGNRRPDLLIGDDLEKDEDVENDLLRQWLYETWWEKAVRPMLHPTRGTIIVVGTILHFDSLLSKLLEDTETYATRLWTCYTAEGESQWPERFPLAWLHFQQRRNPLGFAQEYLNDPRPVDTRVFRPEVVKYYTGQELYRDAAGQWYFQQNPVDIYCGCDPAISEADEACEFGLLVIAVPKDRWDVVVVQVVLGRMDFADQVAKIVRVGEFWQANAVGIEDQAYQKALEEWTRKIIKQSVRIKGLKHGEGKTSKRRRIMALAPLAAQGRLWLRQAEDHEPGRSDELGRVRVHADHWPLYLQLMQYPKGALNDGLDALASAVEVADNIPMFAAGTFTDPRQSIDAIRNRLGLAAYQVDQEREVLRVGGPRHTGRAPTAAEVDAARRAA